MAANLTRRAALISGAALVATACGQPQARPLRAVDTHPADYPTVKAVGHMAKLVAEGSNGRLRIQQFPGGQLGEEKDTLELTIFGGLDLNRVNLAPLNAIVPETVVPTLPFLFRSVSHMRTAMAGAPGRKILDALEPHGLVGLCFYESGARGFYTMSKPVQTPADLHGQKIRVQNSDVFVAMIDALGGDATPMSFGEVYQALLQGVVDGAENNWPSYESSRHFEAARFYSPTAHVIAPEVLVVSRYRWEKLSANEQALLQQAAAESVAVMQTLWDAREMAARERLIKAGVQVAQSIDRAAFETLVTPVWDKFLTTPALRTLANDIRAMGEAA
jgi:tripartite ATP-independent transporter DctP family solute receptor